MERHRVNNFSRDVSDGENYTVLLNQLKPEFCSRDPLQTRDLKIRAEQVCLSLIGSTNLPDWSCRFCKMQTKLVAGST